MAMIAELLTDVKLSPSNGEFLDTLELRQPEPRLAIFYRLVSDTMGQFASEFENLTVPDLEETIEQIIARRQQGIPDVLARRTAGYYPTDPVSLQTAEKVLQERKQQLEQQVRDGNEQFELMQKEKAKKLKQQQKEQEAFEDYKQLQLEMKTRK